MYRSEKDRRVDRGWQARAVSLYRLGYRQSEILSVLPHWLRSSVSRWIRDAIQSNPDLQTKHVLNARSRAGSSLQRRWIPATDGERPDPSVVLNKGKRGNTLHETVIRLYESGFTQAMIRKLEPRVTRSSCSRWLQHAIKHDPDIEVRHTLNATAVLGGQKPTMLVPSGQELTLFQNNQIPGKATRQLGVIPISGDESAIESEILRQQIQNEQYVEPRHNYNLVVKLRLVDKLSLRKSAAAYFAFTKRKISYSTVKRLTENTEIAWSDDEERKWMAEYLLGMAIDEERRGALAKKLASELNVDRGSKSTSNFVYEKIMLIAKNNILGLNES